MAKEKALFQVSLKVMLENTAGEFLVLGARDDGIFVGFHDLPGGRIGANELNKSWSEIIQRELREEIGEVNFQLNQQPLGMGVFTSSSGAPVLCLLFRAKYLGGVIEISSEHTSWQWLDLCKEKLEEIFLFGLLDAVKMALFNIKSL